MRARTVSVIIPTRDRPGATRNAIESALAQSHSPLEVIVVDDASVEPFAYEHPVVRVLRQDRHRGAGAARNRGTDAAFGEWVAFLDSDDCWLPEKLEQQFQQLGDPPMATLCCCNVVVMSASGDAGSRYNVAPPSGDLSEWILVGGNSAQTSGLMLPRELAARIRFDENLPHHQDWDFFLRATGMGLSLSYVHDPLVLYGAARCPDRISSTVTAADTLAWIDSSGGGRFVTQRARHEVSCRSATSPGLRKQPVMALSSLGRALLDGSLSFLPTLGWVSRSVRRKLPLRRHTVPNSLWATR